MNKCLPFVTLQTSRNQEIPPAQRAMNNFQYNTPTENGRDLLKYVKDTKKITLTELQRIASEISSNSENIDLGVTDNNQRNILHIMALSTFNLTKNNASEMKNELIKVIVSIFESSPQLFKMIDIQYKKPFDLAKQNTYKLLSQVMKEVEKSHTEPEQNVQAWMLNTQELTI
jgi:hypothetical protein